MTATKQKYQVVEGIHYEINPNFKGDKFHDPDRLIKVEKGGVIESDRDLERLYPNKFKKVGAEGLALNVTDARRKAVTEMISAGGWAESDRPFLEGLSEEGFERIQGMTARSNATANKPGSVLGQDVTDQYQRAYDEGLKVWRNAQGKHAVTKASAPNKPLNTQPLDQDKVEKFVTDYLKEK